MLAKVNIKSICSPFENWTSLPGPIWIPRLLFCKTLQGDSWEQVELGVPCLPLLTASTSMHNKWRLAFRCCCRLPVCVCLWFRLFLPGKITFKILPNISLFLAVNSKSPEQLHLLKMGSDRDKEMEVSPAHLPLNDPVGRSPWTGASKMARTSEGTSNCPREWMQSLN